MTPRGSGEEKFAYAGSAEELAETQRKVGDQNRQAVLATLQSNAEALSTGELVAALQAAGTTLSQDTVTRHCQALVKDGRARKIGTNKDTRFIALTAPPHGPYAEAKDATA